MVVSSEVWKRIRNNILINTHSWRSDETSLVALVEDRSARQLEGNAGENTGRLKFKGSRHVEGVGSWTLFLWPQNNQCFFTPLTKRSRWTELWDRTPSNL